jgi:hypothetical protein
MWPTLAGSAGSLRAFGGHGSMLIYAVLHLL